MNNLLKAFIQRIIDVEQDDAEISLICILDQDPSFNYDLVNELYLSLQIAGAGSLRDVADIRARHLGYEGIDDLLAYGKRDSCVFEG